MRLFSSFCRWKYEGPSDSFKALVDMAAVHSSCRLCIFLATNIQKKEEANEKFQKRPCSCTSNHETTYHLFVRERGRLKTESIFLRYCEISLSLSLVPSAIFQYSLLVLLDPCSLNEFVICFPVFHPILRLKHQYIYIFFI